MLILLFNGLGGLFSNIPLGGLNNGSIRRLDSIVIWLLEPATVAIASIQRLSDSLHRGQVQKKQTGSPGRSIHRTFRAVFEIPDIPSSHNLIKVCKRQYRNPVYLAKEWRGALDNGEYASLAALARHHKVSRPRVTQIMNLLKLSPAVCSIISSLGDPISSPVVTERRLRPLLALTAEQQKTELGIMLSKDKHN